MSEIKKICIIVSSGEKTMKWFLLDHIRALSYKYDVTVMANTNNFEFIHSLHRPITTISNHIERKISIWKDIKALLHLRTVFCQQKFDVVHSVTPKAGLLSTIAGVLARIPIRIHTFTGQIWITRSGISRMIIKNMDRVIGLLATNILIDSYSQQQFLVENKIIKADKSLVLGKGSIAGVDTLRFSPNQDVRLQIRTNLKIAESTIVFLFIGRLTIDKGVLDLTQAFSALCNVRDNVHLLIVGPDEEYITEIIRNKYQNYSDKISFVEYTDLPEHYMATSDILCLPSYREGFGNVVIEAASVGIPAIGSRIYGVTDAIEENITGLLHKPGDENSIFEKMLRLIDYPNLRTQMGVNARKRAVLDFSKEKITTALVNYYETLLLGINK